AQVAADRAAFSITEVVRGITDKMVRRHPHVFGDVKVSGSAEVVRNWQQIKAAEAEAKSRKSTSGVKSMTEATGYVLGQSERAARRLEIQDLHFAAESEQLLDELALRPTDRVVEFGCGPGGFSRRILRRFGDGGVLVGVDSSAALLAQAQHTLTDVGP